MLQSNVVCSHAAVRSLHGAGHVNHGENVVPPTLARIHNTVWLAKPQRRACSILDPRKQIWEILA